MKLQKRFPQKHGTIDERTDFLYHFKINIKNYNILVLHDIQRERTLSYLVLTVYGAYYLAYLHQGK